MFVQVEFQGEEGTGLGPTLEFYALVAAEFQTTSLGIWLCDDDFPDDESRQVRRTHTHTHSDEVHIHTHAHTQPFSEVGFQFDPPGFGHTDLWMSRNFVSSIGSEPSCVSCFRWIWAAA